MKIEITLYRKDLINPIKGIEDITLSDFNIDWAMVMKASSISFIDEDGQSLQLKER